LGPGALYIPNGGVFSAKGWPLVVYLAFAYEVTTNQIMSMNPQLPAWTKTDRYDIEARSGNRNATKDQMRLMMRTLLADRFKLAIHSETRQGPALALVLVIPGTTGPLLHPHPAGEQCSTLPSGDVAGTFPSPCGGLVGMPPKIATDSRIGARNVTMGLIASSLLGIGGGIDRPILDRTGLRGTYDFVVEWAPQANNLDPGHSLWGQGIIAALRDQLGLKLESTTGYVETLVIDHIEKPAGESVTVEPLKKQ
jgi:uncharacterized protein (TIGR03435 family)